MPGIKISKGLKKKLPEEQQSDLEERLWEMSKGNCHLCGEPMNRVTDTIEADHDLPENHSGKTTIENLNLAHKSCNAAKSDNPTVDVRPYLKLDAFIRKRKEPVRYGECTAFFNITPTAIALTRLDTGRVRFELPAGKISEVSVFQTKNADGEFEYCFVELPRNALFNDEDCQPRNIKKAQAWAIYLDLQRNPLHEPPSCRVVDHGKKQKLLMFDGQHKTVASWMCGHTSIVAKVYLNITLHQTTRLVNSVQAKIKKLPLSPFEVAAKLGDEWEHKWSEYESAVGTENASEDDFIGSLKPNDRKRGAQAFQEARLRTLLDREDLSFLRFVKRAGAVGTEEALIPEATFKNKVLKTLVYSTPLKEKGDAGARRRAHETDNIVRVLNYLSDKVFEPKGQGVALSEEERETRKRFVYQGALKFCSEMLQRIVRHCCTVDEDDLAFIDADIDDKKWLQITAAIDRFVGHPIWTKDFSIGPRAQAVLTSLTKNQQVKESMKNVGLSVGYAIGVDSLSSDWFK